MVEISQNFVAFSEYMNFTLCVYFKLSYCGEQKLGIILEYKVYT